MPLGTYALVDLELAREYVLRDKADDSADSKLEFLVNSKSRAIRRYLSRELKPKTDGAARKFVYDGRGLLNLAPYELRSVTSIVVHSDLPASAQDTLSPGDASTAAEYRLEPRNKTLELTYLWLRLPKLSLCGERARFGAEVTITGNWGVDTVPEDVQEACLIAVKAAYSNPEDVGTREMGEYSFTVATEAFSVDRTSSLPQRSRSLLIPFRRLVLAS